MNILEKYGDATIVDCSGALPNSEKKGIVIELTWSYIEYRESRGFFRTIWDGFVRLFDWLLKEQDLDLGCFYELNNGSRGLIDPVQFHGRGGGSDRQTMQGCLKNSPFIWHQGDEHGVSGKFCEKIYVNSVGLKDIKRIQVYAFIWPGLIRRFFTNPHWYDTDAKVNIYVGGTLMTQVSLDKVESKKRFCVVADVVVNNRNLSIRRLSTFHKNHSECDSKYAWGFHWTSGTK